MFSADGSLEPEGQVAALLGNPHHPGHVLGLLQVQEDHDVEVAVAGMAVNARLRPVPLQNLPQAGDIRSQPHERGLPERKKAGQPHAT